MADTTTQKLNTTIYWSDFVSNSYTLFTTDAVTRYVIKDVELASNTFSGNFSLSVNDTQTASFAGNITGTEIIDINSTVKLGFNTSGANYINLNNIQSAGLFSSGVTDGAVFYTPTGFVNSATTQNTATSISSLTNSSSITGGWVLNGNFYYIWNDGNSQQALYRRAGGPTGSESTIYQDSYSPCCFDGTSKFYYVNSSGQLYRYDTATGSSSYLASFPAGTTYPMISYVGGYVFFSPSYSGYNQIYWYRATGGSGSFSATAYYSSLSGSVGFYNSSTGAIRICNGSMNSFSTSYYTYDFNISSGTPVFVASSSSASTAGAAFRYNSMNSLGNVAIMFGSNTSSNTIYMVDNTMSIIATKTITGAVYGTNGQVNTGSYQIIDPSTSVKQAVSPSVKMRITGVQTV